MQSECSIILQMQVTKFFLTSIESPQRCAKTCLSTPSHGLQPQREFDFCTSFGRSAPGKRYTSKVFKFLHQSCYNNNLVKRNNLVTMLPYVSASKAARAVLSRSGGGVRHLARSAQTSNRLEKLVPARCLSSIAGPFLDNKLINTDKHNTHLMRDMHKYAQVRGFLGCGDGEEGTVLSKTYEEKINLGYSPEQLFAVVAAVDMYEDFLPWCQSSKIVRHNPDGSFDAELKIGFQFFVESYMSHVELNKPKSIKTTASESDLFDYLINIWEFNPGPVPGSCSIYFMVDFKFQSPLYSKVASMFFKEVVSRLVGSFNDRCRLIYGPAVQVLENSYRGQR